MKYLTLLLAITLTGCSDSGPQKPFEMPPVPVETAQIEVRDVPLFFEALGVMKPAENAEVKPRVNGVIKEIHFTEGQWIEEGDLLYTIEDAPYAIKVMELQSQRSQDLVSLSNSKKKLERFRSLVKKDLIAEVEWDDLQTKISLGEAVLEASEARLAAAKLDLEHCKIRAPIGGYAGKSSLGIGNMVTGNMVTGSTLVTLTQTSPLHVDFQITEKELNQIKSKSPKIEVYLAGDEEAIGSGFVTFMDHAIDSKSGMLSASGIIEKTSKPLWPGQHVRVQLYFGKKEGARLIPMRAVKTNQDGPYIMSVKEDNSVEIRKVTLGPEEKGFIVVEDGLGEAAKVITEGHLRLFPGAKVVEVHDPE